MKEADAHHVVSLYKMIREIDAHIALAKLAHSISVEACANGVAETRRVKLELAENASAVRDVLIAELRALRALRGQGLERLGFDVPECIT